MSFGDRSTSSRYPLQAAGNPLQPSWNPLQCGGTDLPANLAIMVKMLAIVVLLTNHARILPDPWLPFIPSIALIPAVPFQRTLQTVFVIAALAIVFNRRIRIASLVLGTTMLIAVVSSKAYYGNNKTFCGLMFLLAGLYKPGGLPFLRWQLAVTYFGAGLNKLLDGDWQTGVFFQNWAVDRLHQTWYMAVDSWLPPMALARIMCWATIFTELGIVPCILLPRLYYWAILLNIIFQAGLLLFTGTTFTLFFYSMTGASLAFVTWPSESLSVIYNPAHGLAKRARRFFQPWDLDRRFLWISDDSSAATPSGLQLLMGDKVYSGFRALRMIVLLNPITYFAIAGAIAACDYVPSAPFFRRLIVAVSLILLMPPLAWIADRLAGNAQLQPAAASADNRLTQA